ncbi:valine--pyruvate transaminase [bacterium]|nr:valine--pyruvate transaminase [bacterium]
MKFSSLGQRLSGGSGIEHLMDDLGNALSATGPSPLMLGGGNPAHIPEMERIWEERLSDILNEPATLRRTLAIYDPPRGNARVIEDLASLLRQEYGWQVGPENIAVTPGGQTAFYFLFNLFGGRRADGSMGRIMFPLMPEYIGYANQCLEEGMFTAQRPRISRTRPHRFKYHIDFENLNPGSDVAALCVSRPTNPSGNVIPDSELQRLAALAKDRQIPLIIDNAYGWPFPGIVFGDATPIWNEQTVHVMSLSKFGLPGTRTAFVVAPPEIAKAVSSMMAVTGLANGNFGQSIAGPLIADGRITRLSREVIRPYYLQKRNAAMEAVEEFFPDHVPYAFHESEGALFLWLWLEGSRKSSRQIYDDLKKRGVLVVPGEYFFFGDDDPDWKHRHECLRISFAMADADVRAGIKIIGEEIAKAY